MKRILAFTLIPLAVLACAGPQINVEEEVEEETKTYSLDLQQPENSTVWTLEADKTYTFSWQAVPGQTNYKLLFSKSQDLSSPYTVSIRKTSQDLDGRTLDGYLQELGIASEATADIWWSVLPYKEVAHTEYTTFTRKLTVTRLAEEKPDWGPVEEPLVVKVAVIYEDPYYTNISNASDPWNGKRIHEIFSYNDPHAQMLEYARDFEEVSHGAVDIQIVHEFSLNDRLFSYYSEGETETSERRYVTPVEICNDFIKDHKNIDGVGLEYDYPGVLDHFGISEMIDAGEVNEVWIYNHPSCSMNESRLMGQGGFWCNSGPIDYGQDRYHAHNKKLVCVMFCNYERTVDLALHSFAHRTESIMSHLYYNENFHWFPNDSHFSGLKKDLRAFDKFFSHGTAYEKVSDKGYAHIGTCHSPCNTDVNYGYSEYSYIYTYADEWDNYPYIEDNPDNARRVNCTEWNSTQYGYMKWFYKHIPHFKGINTHDPNDLHLNNWWYYLFDYYGAVEYEQRLQRELL